MHHIFQHIKHIFMQILKLHIYAYLVLHICAHFVHIYHLCIWYICIYVHILFLHIVAYLFLLTVTVSSSMVELDTVGRKHLSCRWRPCGVAWDAVPEQMRVWLLKLRRKPAFTARLQQA